MYSNKIEKLLKELRNEYVKESTLIDTSVTLVLNGYGWNTTITQRTPDSLKEEGISMKNLKGDFIG